MASPRLNLDRSLSLHMGPDGMVRLERDGQLQGIAQRWKDQASQ